MSIFNEIRSSKPQPLSGYYADAFDRISGSVPLASFRVSPMNRPRVATKSLDARRSGQSAK